MNSIGIILVTCLIVYIEANSVHVNVDQDVDTAGDGPPPPPPPPPTPQISEAEFVEALSGAGIIHLGCYQDSPKPNQILKGISDKISANTPQICIQFCDQRNFTYAGVSFGYLCSCGNDEPNAGLIVSQHYCNYKCPGDQFQTCGAFYLIDIYQLNDGSK